MKVNLKLNIKHFTKNLNNHFRYMFQSQPTRYQRQEIWRLKKIIETAKFNCKLLSKEKDRKTAYLRHLTQSFNKLSDENDYTCKLNIYLYIKIINY